MHVKNSKQNFVFTTTTAAADHHLYAGYLQLYTTNNVITVYSVAAILYLQFMVYYY